MTWAVLVPLVVQHGLPFAEKMWALWQSNGVPTAADWADLRALSNQTPESQMMAAMQRAGVDIDNPRARDLLALVKPHGAQS